MAGLIGVIALLLGLLALRLRRRLLVAWMLLLGVFPIYTFVTVVDRALSVRKRWGRAFPLDWFADGDFVLGLVGGLLLLLAGVLVLIPPKRPTR